MSEARVHRFDKVVREAIEARLAELHVSLPCSVISYDAAKQTVSLQPLLTRKRRAADGTVTSSERPSLQNVPVAFPRCAGGWITFPLAKDDVGMVVFAERSIADWMGKAAGEIADPTDEAFHPLGGAWFVPGGYPSASALSGGADSANVVIHAGSKLDLGEKGLTDVDHFVALAKLVKAEITALRNTVNGWVSVFAGHTHTGVTTGPGTSGTTAAVFTPPAAVGDVAATKVRAK